MIMKARLVTGSGPATAETAQDMAEAVAVYGGHSQWASAEPCS